MTKRFAILLSISLLLLGPKLLAKGKRSRSWSQVTTLQNQLKFPTPILL
jgi:hypothetical protein